MRRKMTMDQRGTFTTRENVPTAPNTMPITDSPFAEAVPYYKHRAPYAPAALEYLVDQVDLNDRSRVLDLGCGTGTIASPLSRFVRRVLAVDPCQAMIAEGQAVAAALSR